MLRRLMPAATILALVLAGGSLAYTWAAIPDSNGVIHGCRRTTDGTLKVIDTAVRSSCPKGYEELTWNQTGPAGISGWQTVRTDVETVLAIGDYWYAQASLQCPTGKIAVGGGYTYVSSGSTPVEAKAFENGPRSFTYGARTVADRLGGSH